MNPDDATGATGVLTWVDGEPGATVPTDDRGLLYGDGLFETLVWRDGRLRFFDLHWQRLAQGCDALGLPRPERAPLARELCAAADAAPGDALLRLTLTRGSSTQRGYAPPSRPQPRRVLARHPLEAPDAAPRPFRVMLSPVVAGLAPALAGFKHLNRLENVMARAQLAGSGCDEALLLDAGGLLVGGTMSNLFALLDGVLVTPGIVASGIRGVMRAVVLREAAALGVETREAALRPADLARATELFVTNVRLGVQPVAVVEPGRPVAAPGPVTRALRERTGALAD